MSTGKNPFVFVDINKDKDPQNVYKDAVSHWSQSNSGNQPWAIQQEYDFTLLSPTLFRNVAQKIFQFYFFFAFSPLIPMAFSV